MALALLQAVALSVGIFLVLVDGLLCVQTDDWLDIFG